MMKLPFLDSLLRRSSRPTDSAALQTKLEQNQKLLLGRLSRMETRQIELICELDAIRDRVTLLLDNSFCDRKQNYGEAAHDLSLSIRRMERLPETNSVHAVFITDSGYALPTAVAISSMLRHRAEGTRYKISVVCNGLDEHDAALFGCFGPAVEILAVGNRYAHLFSEHHHVSEAALLKFDLPTLFPADERILYLDGDILVLDDLYDLWNTELDGKFAAVVKDYAYCLRGSGTMLGHSAYFNSGVMLLNSAKLREIDIAAKLLDAKKHEPVDSFMDQTAFNMVLGDNVEYLPPKYNMLQTSFRKQGGTSFKKIADFYEVGEGCFERMFEHPAVLHLAGKLKPWSSRFAPSYEKWHDEARIYSALGQPSASACHS